MNWYPQSNLLTTAFVPDVRKENWLFEGYYFTDPSRLVQINLAFAISVTSLESDRNFRQMQNIIKSVVDNYPTSNIFYSVLSFGDTPVVHINFDDQLSNEDRKRAIDSITKTTGIASLDKALETARDLFNTASTQRPTAKNILVVMVDGKSDSKLDDVKASSRLLQADGVKVIVVGVGDEVDKPEIDVVTETTALTNTTDNPDSVAEVIIITIDKGKWISVKQDSCRVILTQKFDCGVDVCYWKLHLVFNKLILIYSNSAWQRGLEDTNEENSNDHVESFLLFCPLGLTMKLNFNISKVV